MPLPAHFFFFFFNDTATTEIYTLSLHDALPISPGLGVMELARRCKSKFSLSIPPVIVDGLGQPANENHLRDDKVDIRDFPAARHWARDGGEYIGTCDAIITRDPDGGWLNVGTYRQMVQAKDQVGLYLSPGKDARLHIERCWSRGEACEVVMCWGIDPG